MDTRKITYSSVLIAIGVLLPFIFHYAFPSALQLGKWFLPIHYSAYFAGGLLGPSMGAIVGLFTPMISFLVTGMPSYPFVLYIAIETFFYGIVFGYLFFSRRINVYLSLVLAMILGRIANFSAVYVIGHKMIGNPFVFSIVFKNFMESMTIGLVGVAFQLLIIPIVIKRLNTYLNNR